MPHQYKKYFQNMDFWLVGAVVILSLFGLVAITSATRVNIGESPSLVIKQAMFFVFGLLLMLIAMNVDYEEITKFHLIIYIGNLFLLVLVLLIGTNVNGAVRWISIGGENGISIQPSEFTKVIMIYCTAFILKNNQNKINKLLFLIGIACYVAIPIALIQMQPALSASLVLFAVLLIQLFVAGISFVIIRNVAVVILPVLGFVLFDVASLEPLVMDKILRPHQFNRILAFVDPSRDPSLYYQTEKSISAIGSGELTGMGIFNGTLNQLSYLPEPHNDFIFSVVGEEFGFVGCILVLGLLMFIIFRCIVVATATRDVFSQLIAVGVGGMIAFQTFINVGVAVGIVPNTGMSLPFVGYGGSAMWTNMVAIGLVLNIRKKSAKSLFEGGLL